MSHSLQEAPVTALIVDVRGNTCPGPLLEARKAIGNVEKGEVLEVVSDDPEAGGNISEWAEKVGHEFLGNLDTAGAHRLFLKRGP